MQTFTVKDAKQNLGKVMAAALQSPVSITKHGRLSVIVTSDAEFQEYISYKYQKLKEAVTAGFDQLDRGELSKFTIDEIYENFLRRKDEGS
jgi:prevent-host-death family protein